MSQISPQSLLETAIERRNFYQGRLVENMVNVIVYERDIKESKPDTQQRVDAKNNKNQAEQNVIDNHRLLDCFDVLIEQIKKETNE